MVLPRNERGLPQGQNYRRYEGHSAGPSQNGVSQVSEPFRSDHIGFVRKAFCCLLPPPPRSRRVLVCPLQRANSFTEFKTFLGRKCGGFSCVPFSSLPLGRPLARRSPTVCGPAQSGQQSAPLDCLGYTASQGPVFSQRSHCPRPLARGSLQAASDSQSVVRY